MKCNRNANAVKQETIIVFMLAISDRYNIFIRNVNIPLKPRWPVGQDREGQLSTMNDQVPCYSWVNAVKNLETVSDPYLWICSKTNCSGTMSL